MRRESRNSRALNHIEIIRLRTNSSLRLLELVDLCSKWSYFLHTKTAGFQWPAYPTRRVRASLECVLGGVECVSIFEKMKEIMRIQLSKAEFHFSSNFLMVRPTCLHLLYLILSHPYTLQSLFGPLASPPRQR